MTKDQIKNTSTYKQVMRDIVSRGGSPCIVAYGGSYAYGTNVETSDVDLRGIYFNSLDELIGTVPDKEQYVRDDEIDIQLYSLKKAVWLLQACNPAMIEIMGCRDQDYIFMSPQGRILKDGVSIFLSKRAIKTFGGYAQSQLNRLVNRSGRSKDLLLDNEERSFEKAFLSLKSRYNNYVDKSAKVIQKDEEILLDFAVEGMPVGKLSNLLNELNSIDRSYRKSSRNDKAIAHNKLSKHMMHLIRLYMMGTEVLTDQVIRTYRDGDEHELLMSIRNGDYLESDGVTPTKEFEKLVDEYQAKYLAACETTKLPDKPDERAINRVVCAINKVIYRSEL